MTESHQRQLLQLRRLKRRQHPIRHQEKENLDRFGITGMAPVIMVTYRQKGIITGEDLFCNLFRCVNCEISSTVFGTMLRANILVAIVT